MARAAKQMVAAMVAVAAAEGSERRAAMAMDSKGAEACAAVTRAECR
jgi:hypothetical protein